MAKTSEITRRHMFPSLLHNLENPCPETLPLVTKGKPDHISIVCTIHGPWQPFPCQDLPLSRATRHPNFFIIYRK